MNEMAKNATRVWRKDFTASPTSRHSLFLSNSGESLVSNSSKSRASCSSSSVTRYRALCITTPAQFSNSAKTSPSKWACAWVLVTIGETKKVVQYLMEMKKYREMSGRYRIPLSDCIECFQNAID
ncbi:hypothetical protein V6N12_057401 [Hibiscus sabdariffa]|uniref:Pectinesterase inhibitor domain-containing protein n=1 Tax=Hibiscus sabdariffa TaxID=183260 RepID=A0ABR2DDF0_9ROSI